jgi:hypothetical protein
MADSNKRDAQTEQIRMRAYEIYLERGGTDGHELEDWLDATKSSFGSVVSKRT